MIEIEIADFFDPIDHQDVPITESAESTLDPLEITQHERFFAADLSSLPPDKYSEIDAIIMIALVGIGIAGLIYSEYR